ncbi:DMT family transporter [Paenibacillus vulneris]|uniref:DMT family transporter n=1 Tax=Paenibacillus vulneris TaxID=1133364 RepID=A0ABW3UJ43_9BACL
MKETIYFILSMIIFGAVGVFAKYIDLRASVIALFMSLIGSMFLFIICMSTKHKISRQIIRRNVVPLFIASLALCGNWIFLFQSYKETTIANAAISYYFAPVLVIVMSPVVLKEKLSLKKAICVVIALIGLVLIVQSNKTATAEHNLLGIIYGLIAAGFYAVLTLVNKFIRNMNGLENTFIQIVLSSVILLPYVFITEGFPISRISGNSIILLLLLGIFHAGVGFYLFFTGMSGLKAQSVAVLSYIDPLTSLFISVLVIGEKMTLLQLAGAALLLGSTLLSETSRGKKT